jgi:hypothetical protein
MLVADSSAAAKMRRSFRANKPSRMMQPLTLY